jgi:hypothetical protein
LANTPLIVFSPMLLPLSVRIAAPLVAPGVIPLPKVSAAELLLVLLAKV